MKRMYQKIKLIEFGSRHLIHVENDQKEKKDLISFYRSHEETKGEN